MRNDISVNQHLICFCFHACETNLIAIRNSGNQGTHGSDIVLLKNLESECFSEVLH